MVSRKNIKYKMQQDAKRVPHYGIRKLSIGVASVLLGTVFYMQNGTVHADVNSTVSTGNDNVNVVNKDSGTSGSAGVAGTSTGVGSADSASSVVFAGNTTNSMVTSQTSGSSVEGETKQANNAALTVSEPESTSSGGQVNVGTDNSNSISSLPPASHHQASVGNQSNERLFDNLSLSVNQKLNVNNSSLLASKAALTGISNQRFAGLQQSLVQSAIQSNSAYKSSEVQNVVFSLKNTDSTSDRPKVASLGVSQFDINGYSLQFDVDGTQLAPNKVIHIGDLIQSNNLNSTIHVYNEYYDNIAVKINNVIIGKVRVSNSDYGDLSWDLVCDSNISKLTGVQHILVTSSHAFAFNYFTNLSVFRGIKNPYMTLTWSTDPSVSYRINFVFFEAPQSIKDGSYYWCDPIQSGTWIHDGVWMSESEFDYFRSHNGMLPMGTSYKPVILGFNTSGSNIYIPQSRLGSHERFSLGNSFFLVDSSGRVLNNSFSPASNTYADPFYAGVLMEADNLSVSQLAALNQHGIVISHQSNGSYNYVIHFDPIDFQYKDTSTLRAQVKRDLLNYSQVINQDSDPEKAADNTVKYLFDTLHGQPLASLGAGYGLFESSDESLDSQGWTELVDVDTGKTIKSASWYYKGSSSHVSGRSTVKLHVITPSDVALQQVKSFTDWPNQNKHASLTIPSITGYELVSNPQSVLSALHLSGTAISSSVQVDYPAENTVADYYVVFQPKTESATVQIVDADESNKVLATGTVSGRFGEQIVSSADIQSKLDSLIKTGHYVLASNGFDSGVDYQDGTNTITIVLKHKIDSTQRHYRVIEDLPDGTKKVIIDLEATLYKDANTDKWQSDAAYLNGDRTKKVLMSNIYKLNVGQQIGDGLPNFLKAYIDKVLGYAWNLVDGTAGYQDSLFVGFYNSDEKNAGEICMDLFNGLDVANNVASIFPSHDFHIIYTPRSYPVTVNYYDIDGKLVDSVTSMHKFGDTVSIAPVAPANYVLASGQAKVDYLTGLGLNEVDFLIEPKVTMATQTKMVSRTIRVQTPDGRMNDVVQTVTFVRNSYLNQVTKQTTYSPWSFDGQYQFSGYQPKPMGGYTADVVPAVIVTPDSLDTMANVVYHKIPVVYEIDYKLANGTLVTKAQGAATGDGMIHLTAPQGYRLLTTVPDVQVGHSSQKLSVLVLPDEQTYTSYSALPSSVTEPLTKTITRTINITMPNGRVRRVVQQVHFIRTATVAANGKITYSNWTGVGQTSFDRLFVPKRRGYRLVMTNNQDQTLIGVNQMVVDPTMDNVVINVKYVK